MKCVYSQRKQLCHGHTVFSGYDSDVAREKLVDYVTKIYSASIRNMSGTRPHLQHRELPVDERYHDAVGSVRLLFFPHVVSLPVLVCSLDKFNLPCMSLPFLVV